LSKQTVHMKHVAEGVHTSFYWWKHQISSQNRSPGVGKLFSAEVECRRPQCQRAAWYNSRWNEYNL